MNVNELKSVVLYLDDEESNLTAFKATFRHHYSIHTAVHPKEALDLIEKNPIEVIVTDQRMPEMDGVTFLENVRKINPYPIRIILSAYTDVESIIQSINTGKIFYYIKKPWIADEVKQILDGAIRIFRLEKENRNLLTELKDLNANLETKIRERTQELENTQQQLVTTAHLAGMSQVATNVIHNVGNILNSINTSISLIIDELNQSKLSKLIKSTRMLEDYQKEKSDIDPKDNKKALLPEYIVTLTESLQNEQEKFTREIKYIQKNIRFVNHIIDTQQSLTGENQLSQKVELTEIIDDALKITSSDIVKYKITIQKEYENVKPIIINKIKLLQILINLISNARDSLIDSNQENKLITIKLFSNINNKLYIQVSDNGIGIKEENLKKIFTFGFTTKPEGHGFGLHSCAMSIVEMNGQIKVESEGLNKGATFTLELPYQNE